jgi:hypothetical protein
MLAAVTVALVVSLGCSPKPKEQPKVAISGTIVSDGKPLPLDSAGFAAKISKVELKFFRSAKEGGGADFSETAFAGPDGKFQVRLPVGTYRVAVAHYDKGQKELLNGKFDQQKTKLKCEVTDATKELSIDLAKP